MTNTYLMIDDDVELSELTQRYLAGFDAELTLAHTPEEGLALLENNPYQLVILDVMLPNMNGFEVCQKIRQTSDIPILMLTARGDLTDKVLGLELGCDDYLAKPFEPRELVARCQSLVRRAKTSPPKKDAALQIVNHQLQLNQQNLEVSFEQKRIKLTAMETDALNYLMKKQGQTISRDELLNELKGIEAEIFSRSIDILMSRLRTKLKKLTQVPLIYTIRGKGYRYWESDLK